MISASFCRRRFLRGAMAPLAAVAQEGGDAPVKIEEFREPFRDLPLVEDADVTVESMGMVIGQSMTWNWTGDSVTIAVVPEPATGLLGALGTSILLARRR